MVSEEIFMSIVLLTTNNFLTDKFDAEMEI